MTSDVSAARNGQPPDRDAIATLLFHAQRRLHPGHVLGKRRCEEIVDFVLDHASRGDR